MIYCLFKIILSIIHLPTHCFSTLLLYQVLFRYLAFFFYFSSMNLHFGKHSTHPLPSHLHIHYHQDCYRKDYFFFCLKCHLTQVLHHSDTNIERTNLCLDGISFFHFCCVKGNHTQYCLILQHTVKSYLENTPEKYGFDLEPSLTLVMEGYFLATVTLWLVY